MAQIDQRQKTMVFCATQEHALRVRDHINQIKTNPHPNYCQRVTAADGALGDLHLIDFRDTTKTLPTILTTSQKLSTGVDAPNLRNIVLMRPVGSMIESKQIIGRGTRLFDGKEFFTVFDFVRAHEHFNDPEWDGEPLPPEGPAPARSAPPAEPQGEGEPGEPADPEGEAERAPKIVIRLADGKERTIRYIAATSYWGPGGQMMTAQQFMERLYGDLAGLIGNEDELRAKWSDPDQREHFIDVLRESGYSDETLTDMRRVIDAPQSDLFDVLAYVRFTTPPKTRTERAEAVQRDGLDAAQPDMRAFLAHVLRAYEAKGESELALRKLGDFVKAKYGTFADARAVLGGMDSIKQAFVGVQRDLYRQ